MTDNEVLAEFAGWQKVLNSDLWINENPPLFCTKLQSKFYFDLSFDWLMPVWYKFKELKYPVPSSLSSGQFYGLFLDHQGQIIRSILHSGCAEACKLLAEGIRWYQSIKK